jgi:amino acid transporter
MALVGDAPAIFRKCNKHGVPYMAVGASSIFSVLAYLRCGASGSQVFDWFVNLTNTCGYISWICCCILYIRFNKACKVQGLDRSELPYTSRLHPYASWVTLVFLVFLTLVNGYAVFAPGQWNTSTFMTAYVGIPAFVIIYLGHRIVHRSDPWLINPGDVDLVTGLDEVLAAEEDIPEMTFKEKTKEFFFE